MITRDNSAEVGEALLSMDDGRVKPWKCAAGIESGILQGKQPSSKKKKILIVFSYFPPTLGCQLP